MSGQNTLIPHTDTTGTQVIVALRHAEGSAFRPDISPNALLGEGVTLEALDTGCTMKIYPMANIGNGAHVKTLVVGQSARIGAGSTVVAREIHANAVIGKGTSIWPLTDQDSGMDDIDFRTRIGDDVTLRTRGHLLNVHIGNRSKVRCDRIGEGSYIGLDAKVFLSTHAGVPSPILEIDNEVQVEHSWAYGHEEKRITLGEGVFIGANCKLRAGLTVPPKAIVPKETDLLPETQFCVMDTLTVIDTGEAIAFGMKEDCEPTPRDVLEATQWLSMRHLARTQSLEKALAQANGRASKAEASLKELLTQLEPFRQMLNALGKAAQNLSAQPATPAKA